MNANESACRISFLCKHCPKTFLHNKNLEQHILNKHGKDKLKIKPLHCSECLKTKQVTKYFAKEHLLNTHIRYAHSQRRFECDICFKKFTFLSTLRKHQRVIHSTNVEEFKIEKLKKYKCDLCSKVFSLNQRLQVHLFKVHHHKSEGIKYIKCDCCEQEFTQISHLERHVVAKHVVDKEFECDICSKRFIDQKALEKHVEGHDIPIQYFCDICFKGFKHKRGLTHHVGAQHKNVFNCGQCLKCFTNTSEFDEHLNSGSATKSKLEFKCQSCRQILPSQCALNVHIHSHFKTKIIKSEKATEEQPKQEIKCEHCSKIFEREASFAAHRNYVHPNAKWTCDFEECTKSFRHYSRLREHKMTTHSDLKTYVCPTCPKTFDLPAQLNMHLKTHLDEKPFKCDMCPKSFVKGWARKLHIANKHGGPKPIKCSIPNCSKTFPDNASLKLHLKSHETEKMFKCEICMEHKEFKSQLGLKHHLRVKHSEANG